MRLSYTASVISLVAALAGPQLIGLYPEEASAQVSGQQNQLEVKFASNVAESYSVQVNADEKYTISQSYSWIRDDSSRYSLVSYSLDDGDPVEIPRKARGTLSLDVPMDSDHTLTFVAAIQYPISAGIHTSSNADNVIRFNPSSPTGDNWFDADTSVAVTAPYYMVQQEQQSRLQLVAWTLDTSNLKQITIPSGDDPELLQQEEFSTSSIVIASPHSIDFFTRQQYYLNVISEHGTVAGTGWYDSGSEATVSIKPDTNSFPVNHVFEGSDGAQWMQADRHYATILMDSPKTLVAKWTPDYGQLFMVTGAAVALAATAAVIIRKRRAKTQRVPLAFEGVGVPASVSTVSSSMSSPALLQPSQEEERPARVLHNNPRTNGDDYARNLMHFALTKSLETLELLHASGLVPGSRIGATRNKLEQSFA